jgi:hypothetical protein
MIGHDGHKLGDVGIWYDLDDFEGVVNWK